MSGVIRRDARYCDFCAQWCDHEVDRCQIRSGVQPDAETIDPKHLVVRRIIEIGWALYDKRTDEKVWPEGTTWVGPHHARRKLKELREIAHRTEVDVA